MQKLALVAVAITCLGLGCLAATVYGPLVVPAARAGATVTKWEQLCVPSRDAFANKNIASSHVAKINHPTEGWNRVLKEYGAQGWELVAPTYENEYITAFCFKRPL